MLVAYDRRGKPVPAREAIRHSVYRCGYCQALVILHQGLIRTPHYAHHPGSSDCPGAAPESAAHMEMKWHLYEWLREVPGVKVRALEHRLGGPDALRRADVWAETSSGNIAFECQVSPLTPGDLRTKLSYPADTRVFWCMVVHHSVLDLSNCKLVDLEAQEARIPAWVQELHTLYEGRVYVYEDSQIYPLRLTPISSRTTTMRADADYPIMQRTFRCERTTQGFALAWFEELSLRQQLTQARNELAQARSLLQQRQTESSPLLRAVLVAGVKRDIARARHRVARLERACAPAVATKRTPAAPPVSPDPKPTPATPPVAPAPVLDVQQATAIKDKGTKQQTQPVPADVVPTSTQKVSSKAGKSQATSTKPKSKQTSPSKSKSPIVRERLARHAFHDMLQQELKLETRQIQMQQEQGADAVESKELDKRLARTRKQTDDALRHWYKFREHSPLGVDPVDWCAEFSQVRRIYRQAWELRWSLQQEHNGIWLHRDRIKEVQKTEETARFRLQNMIEQLKAD